MTAQRKHDLPLSPYRVLDLTRGGCLLCGKALGDLGADVIKIEPPGGDPSRNVGPFYKDTPDPEKSLFWFAYSANKRSITLEIETADGRALFKRLVRKADFILESFEPGYMDSLGLGFSVLQKLNERIILTSMTPFGQNGPKSGYKGSDLISWASGGMLYTMGDPDRPPTWISSPQASLHAAVEGAIGSLVAHWSRESTGKGQQVDVSAQKCSVATLQAVPEMWTYTRYIYRRAGPRLIAGSGLKRRQFYPCQDGDVAFIIMGGPAPGVNAATKALINWMAEERAASDWLIKFDWGKDFDIADPVKFPQPAIDRIEAEVVSFFKNKTKAELYREALKRGIILTPVSNTADIVADQQLKGRDFWLSIPHPELGESLTYCGPFARFSRATVGVQRRAPLIGEHNYEVYQRELRLSRAQVTLLKQSGVI